MKFKYIFLSTVASLICFYGVLNGADAQSEDYSSVLSKIPQRYDEDEGKKIGQNHLKEREKNKFRYNKFFLSFGIPYTHGLKVTNMDSLFEIPSLIEPGTTEIDFIKDLKMKSSASINVGFDYRPLDYDYIRGLRIALAFRKVGGVFTSTNPPPTEEEEGEILDTNAITYDQNNYDMFINYDFFLLDNDWIVPYAAIGLGIGKTSTGGAASYRKLECDEKPENPGPDGEDGISPPNCSIKKGEIYKMSALWSNINITSKIGVNLFNGYVYIEYGIVNSYPLKDSNYGIISSYTNFGLRIPL